MSALLRTAAHMQYAVLAYSQRSDSTRTVADVVAQTEALTSADWLLKGSVLKLWKTDDANTRFWTEQRDRAAANWARKVDPRSDLYEVMANWGTLPIRTKRTLAIALKEVADKCIAVAVKGVAGELPSQFVGQERESVANQMIERLLASDPLTPHADILTDDFARLASIGQ